MSSLPHHLILDGPKSFPRIFSFEETPAFFPQQHMYEWMLVIHSHFSRTRSLIHTHTPRDEVDLTVPAGGPAVLALLTHASSLSLQMTATAQAPSKAQAVHISAPSAAASTPVPSAPIDPQAQLEADKRAVYR